MIILHFHLQPQFKYESFHIYFTSKLNNNLVNRVSLLCLPWPLACRTGVFFCVFQRNRGEREASARRVRVACAHNSRLALASLSPLFARNTQKITSVLQATWSLEETNKAKGGREERPWERGCENNNISVK